MKCDVPVPSASLHSRCCSSRIGRTYASQALLTLCVSRTLEALDLERSLSDTEHRRAYSAYTPAMNSPPDPRQNHILDALPPLERERLFPHLKLVPLPLGMVVV